MTATGVINTAGCAAPTRLPQAPSTMRAAVITAPGQVEITDAPLPTPGANEIRVKLQGCGVCASNIPPWEGREWFKYPMLPGQLGHEGWGHVEAIGADVSRFDVGDRVGFLSQNAYAEYDITSEDHAVLLRAALADQPFPAEPLGCAMNIFRRSHIRAGDTVAIIGIGFLGALLIQLSTQAGARVVAISQRAYSLDLARRMQADEVIPMTEAQEVIAKVAHLTGGSGGYDVRGFCDVVIECAGKQQSIDLAGELCGVRSRLVIAGYHQDGLRQVNMQLWNWRGLDVINAHERDAAKYVAGMTAAADSVAQQQLNPSPLYTHRFPLTQLADALDMTRLRPDGFVKALVMLDEGNE